MQEEKSLGSMLLWHESADQPQSSSFVSGPTSEERKMQVW